MYAWANYYRRRAVETWKRAAQAIDPAVKAALERAASDWRAHARQAEPLMRNHVATKTNRAAKKARLACLAQRGFERHAPNMILAASRDIELRSW